MSINSTEINSQATSLAQLLFSFFVYVTDAEDGLTAREVQCLQELIDDTQWCSDETLCAGLEMLRNNYGSYWKDYQKKLIQRDLPQISSKLDELLSKQVAPEKILQSCRTFVERLSKNSSPTLVRLGIAAMPAAKLKARTALESLLSDQKTKTVTQETQTSVADKQIPAATEATQSPPPSCSDLSVWPCATLALAQENLWKRGRTPVRCVSVIPETHDVKTFVFQAIAPVLFAYKPGQFATLELPIEGKTVRRSYTISSSPSRPHAISITVKRVPGGLVSNWLHDNMHAGFQFSLSGPHGEFNCFDAPADKLLLIAAGSGITPVMSMLRWLADTSSNADIVFINNIRTPIDVIFENEFKYLGMRLGDKLKLGIIPGLVAPGQSWNGPVCHFNESLVKMLAPDYAERETFVCGPPGYMDMVRTTLERMGYPSHRYHQESFGGAPVAAKPAPPAGSAASSTVTPKPTTPAAATPVSATTPPAAVAAAPANSAQKVELVFSVSAKTVVTTTDDFILDVAEEHGISIPNSCRAGNCGTCKTKKVEGTVEMDGQQALSEADIEEGFVLACVSRACCSRVVIEA